VLGGGGLRAEVTSELEIVLEHAVSFHGEVKLAGLNASELACSNM